MFEDLSSTRKLSQLDLTQRIWMGDSQAEQSGKNMNKNPKIRSTELIEEQGMFKLGWSFKGERKGVGIQRGYYMPYW